MCRCFQPKVQVVEETENVVEVNDEDNIEDEENSVEDEIKEEAENFCEDLQSIINKMVMVLEGRTMTEMEWSQMGDVEKESLLDKIVLAQDEILEEIEEEIRSVEKSQGLVDKVSEKAEDEVTERNDAVESFDIDDKSVILLLEDLIVTHNEAILMDEELLKIYKNTQGQ